MKSKSEIGALEEELPSGKIAKSWVRISSLVAIGVLIFYMLIAKQSYDHQFSKLSDLVEKKAITDVSFVAMTQTLQMFQSEFVIVLLLVAFVPKVVQKYFELKSVKS